MLAGGWPTSTHKLQSGEPLGVKPEVIEALHEEVGRLPEKYRSPIVLCDLGALTRDQAAGRLGWPPGTVAGRLARGRDLLRSRLVRRGVAPAAGLAALSAVCRETSAGVVPPSWAATAVGAASHVAAGRSVTAAVGTVSAAALALSEGVMRTLFWSQIRRLSAAALAAGLASTALIAAAALGSLEQPPGPRLRPETRTQPRPGPVPAGPTVTVRGLVIDVDGSPAAGVAVFASVWGANDAWDPVVAEATTNAGGRFSLAYPARAGGRPAPKPGTLWTYRPGRLVGSYAISPYLFAEGVPARLALGLPARSTLEVRGPDGTPVAGATIMPRVLFRNYCAVPLGLAERVGAEARTDARGRAVLTAFLPEVVQTAFVSAAGHGTQQIGFKHQNGIGISAIELKTKMVNLFPVGRVRGRVRGDSALVRGLNLTVGTNNEKQPSPWPGLGQVTTDDAGRFEIPEFAVGNFGVYLSDADPSKPLYLESLKGKTVEPGKTTDVELFLNKAIPVHGFVREQGTGRPIAGAAVAFAFGDRQDLTTDASGRYQGFVGAGKVHTRVTPPEGYAWLLYGGPQATVPEGVDHYEMPTVELTKAGVIRGVVQDETGRTVAGALVGASWTVNEGPGRQGVRETTIRADALGAFLAEGVPVGVEATFSASHLGLRTPVPVAARVDAAEAIRLRLDASRVASLTGRVVDINGRPIAGATVHLRAEKTYPSGAQVMGDDLVDFDGPDVLTVDALGWYRTPHELDREGHYAAYAAADGYQAERTSWFAGGSSTLPDLILRPLSKD